MMRVKIGIVGMLVACGVWHSVAKDFTGPDEWHTVHTNAVVAWQAAQSKNLPADAVWRGVVADRQRREVRLLAEAVGHRVGITAEFLLVGPLSDRAYEAVAVTVAMPGDIVRAVESLGLARGGCIGSRPFRFWPCGERVTATVRRLDVPDAPARPLQVLINDTEKDDPLVGEGGLVFTGARWEGGACSADTNMPSSVISLYNAPDTVFDVPFRVSQGAVYGRLTLAEALPYGAPLEIVLRPLMPADGRPRVMPLTVSTAWDGEKVMLTCTHADGRMAKKGNLVETLTWLRAESEAGRELYITLQFDDAMPLRRAEAEARIFDMLDGKGIKLDGKADDGLYPRAFLPQEKWREHKGRHPQPFELHVTQAEDGTLSKKLVFIEEDWTVEGLDPKLTPRDYPFTDWEELPKLVTKTGGADSKVSLLFVYAPTDLPLSTFMPGVRAVADRLNLVYVFGN